MAQTVSGALECAPLWLGQGFGLPPLAALAIAAGGIHSRIVAHGVFKRPSEQQLVGHHDDSDDFTPDITDNDDENNGSGESSPSSCAPPNDARPTLQPGKCRTAMPPQSEFRRPTGARRRPVVRDPLLWQKRTTLLRRLLEAAPNGVTDIYLAEFCVRRGSSPILAAVLETQPGHEGRDEGVRSLSYSCDTLSLAVAGLICTTWGPRTLRHLILDYMNENLSDTLLAEKALVHCLELESLGLLHAGPLLALQFVVEPPPAIFRHRHPLFCTLRALHLRAGPSDADQLTLISTALPSLCDFSCSLSAGHGPTPTEWLRWLPHLLNKLVAFSVTSDDDRGIFEALRMLGSDEIHTTLSPAAPLWGAHGQRSQLQRLRCTSLADELQDLAPLLRYLNNNAATARTAPVAAASLLMMPPLLASLLPAPPLMASLTEVIVEYQIDVPALVSGLIDHLPSTCTALGLLKLADLDDTHVASLLIALPQLRTLHIGHCPMVTFLPAKLVADAADGIGGVPRVVVRPPALRRLTVPNKRCQLAVEGIIAAANDVAGEPALVQFPKLRRIFTH